MYANGYQMQYEQQIAATAAVRQEVAPGHRESSPTPQSVKTERSRRFRTAFTDHQTSVMEKEFAICSSLYSCRRRQIAAALGLEERVVKVWFQNQRQKVKRELMAKNEEQKILNKAKDKQKDVKTKRNKENIPVIIPNQATIVADPIPIARDPSKGFNPNVLVRLPAHTTNVVPGSVEEGTPQPDIATVVNDVSEFLTWPCRNDRHGQQDETSKQVHTSQQTQFSNPCQDPSHLAAQKPSSSQHGTSRQEQTGQQINFVVNGVLCQVQLDADTQSQKSEATIPQPIRPQKVEKKRSNRPSPYPMQQASHPNMGFTQPRENFPMLQQSIRPNLTQAANFHQVSESDEFYLRELSNRLNGALWENLPPQNETYYQPKQGDYSPWHQQYVQVPACHQPIQATYPMQQPQYTNQYPFTLEDCYSQIAPQVSSLDSCGNQQHSLPNIIRHTPPEFDGLQQPIAANEASALQQPTVYQPSEPQENFYLPMEGTSWEKSPDMSAPDLNLSLSLDEEIEKYLLNPSLDEEQINISEFLDFMGEFDTPDQIPDQLVM